MTSAKAKARARAAGRPKRSAVSATVASVAETRTAAPSASKSAVTRTREPPNWRETYALIARLRAARSAPVDTLGPHLLTAPNATVDERRYQVLTALQLSSQTRDQVTAEAMKRLLALGLCTPPRVARASQAELEKAIYPVGFYRRKAEYLVQTARIIIDKHDGKVPDSLEGLLALPGVGPKMAHLTLLHAFDVVTGIGVDTHVHRLCNALGWVRKTKTPEETRVQLEAWLPREEWSKLNHELVGLGQMIQQPQHRGDLVKAAKALDEEQFKRAKRLLVKLGMRADHFGSDSASTEVGVDDDDDVAEEGADDADEEEEEKQQAVKRSRHFS